MPTLRAWRRRCYNVADLVELAHTGSLVEMILTAVEQQDLEQRATEAVSTLLVPEFINLVLAVPIANEGQMSEAEALAVLNVTQRRLNGSSHKFTRTNTQISRRRPLWPRHASTSSHGCTQQTCD